MTPNNNVETDPFEAIASSIVPPSGQNVVQKDIKTLLEEANQAVTEQQPAAKVKPVVVNNKVVKPVNAQVIGDDRVFEIKDTHRLVPYEIDRLYKYFDTVETDEELRIVFTPENARWKSPNRNGYQNVLMCAFDATKKYLQNMLGAGLDTADATWYRQHPLTESQGLPEAYTLTVLSDLVRPFGIGISHIYVKKGCSAYDEHLLWQEALGINPEALVDRNKTNAEFIAGLGLEGEALEFMKQQAKTWNFEYVDQIPSPCIAMSGSMTTPVGAAVGGGHTTYYGPRESVRNFKMGLKYDRLENIKYHTELPTFEQTELTQTPPLLELDFYQCLSNNGKPIHTCDTKYVYSGPVSNSGPYSKSWQNEQTARQFGNTTEPSNVLRIGAEKKRSHTNNRSENRRKTRGATGQGKSVYNNLVAEEKAKFTAFTKEYAGCIPEALPKSELKFNPTVTNSACEKVLDVYEKFNVKEMFHLSGADNWQDMLTDNVYGEKFKKAKMETIKKIENVMTILTLFDLYLMVKAAKTPFFKSFMLCIIDFIIYDEPKHADEVSPDLTLEQIEYLKTQGMSQENIEFCMTQGLNPLTGEEFFGFATTPEDQLYGGFNTQMADQLKSLPAPRNSDPVCVYDDVLHQYREAHSGPPIHDDRLEAYLMAEHEVAGPKVVITGPVEMFNESGCEY